MKDDKFTDILDELDDKELLQCLQAAKLADTEPAQEISESKAREFVSAKTTPKVVKVRFPWVAGLSIAAAIAVAAFLFLRNPGQDAPEPVADTTPDSEQVEESITIEEILGEEEVVSMEQAQTKEQKEVRTAKTESKPKAVPEETAEEAVPAQVSQEDVSNAASAEMAMFEMIRPSLDISKVKVKNENSIYSFEWDPTGFDGARLILQDRDGNIFIQEDFTDEDHYDLLASTALEYSIVSWTFMVQYEDGREARKTGVLYFKKAE